MTRFRVATVVRRVRPALALWLGLACAGTGPSYSAAQAPRASTSGTYSPAPEAPAGLATPAELETLITPIAFYPDRLLALVLRCG